MNNYLEKIQELEAKKLAALERAADEHTKAAEHINAEHENAVSAVIAERQKEVDAETRKATEALLSVAITDEVVAIEDDAPTPKRGKAKS